MDTSQPELRFGSSSSSQAIVGFIIVEHGSLLVLKYKINFLEWSRYILILYPSEHKMVHRFIRELAQSFYLALEKLIVVGSSLSQVVDYVRDIERACVETYIVNGKMPCYQYSIIGIPFRSTDSLSGVQLCLQPINSTQVASYTMGGSYINHGDHSAQSSHQTLQSIKYGYLSCDDHFGLVGLAPGAFQDHVMVVVKLVISLYSAPDVSCFLRKIQHMFPTRKHWSASLGQLILLSGQNFKGLLRLRRDQLLVQRVSPTYDYQLFSSSRSVSQCCGTFSQRQ